MSLRRACTGGQKTSARHTGGFATLLPAVAPTDCSRSRPKQTLASRKFPLNSQSKQPARAHIYIQTTKSSLTYLCILNFEGAAARVDVGAVQCVLGSFRWVNAVECELQLRKAKNISLCHPHPSPADRTPKFLRAHKRQAWVGIVAGLQNLHLFPQEKGWPSSLSCPFKPLMKSDTPQNLDPDGLRVVSSAAALLICQQSMSREQGSCHRTIPTFKVN